MYSLGEIDGKVHDYLPSVFSLFVLCLVGFSKHYVSFLGLPYKMPQIGFLKQHALLTYISGGSRFKSYVLDLPHVVYESSDPGPLIGLYIAAISLYHCTLSSLNALSVSNFCFLHEHN